jgi:hypothetical protein
MVTTVKYFIWVGSGLTRKYKTIIVTDGGASLTFGGVYWVTEGSYPYRGYCKMSYLDKLRPYPQIQTVVTNGKAMLVMMFGVVFYLWVGNGRSPSI